MFLLSKIWGICVHEIQSCVRKEARTDANSKGDFQSIAGIPAIPRSGVNTDYSEIQNFNYTMCHCQSLCMWLLALTKHNFDRDWHHCIGNIYLRS
jgi:hypothetical protein